MKAPKIQSSKHISGLYPESVQYTVFHSFTVHHNFYVIASTHFCFSKRSDHKVCQYMPYNVIILTPLFISMVQPSLPTWWYPLVVWGTFFLPGEGACMHEYTKDVRQKQPTCWKDNPCRTDFEWTAKEGYPWPSRLRVGVWGWQTKH